MNGAGENDGEPAWFPSGKRLVFVRGTVGTAWGALWTVYVDGLWIANATTGAAHLIYQTPEGGSIGGVGWR
jgi:hypothetical protein